MIFSSQGNNFASALFAYVDDCEIRFAQSAEWDADASFTLYTSSASCPWCLYRVSCVRDGDVIRIRQDMVEVRPDLVQDFIAGEIEDPDWVRTWTHYQLIDGEIVPVYEDSIVVPGRVVPEAFKLPNQSCASV